MNDLEGFGNYKHGSEFLEIPSKKIGKKSILEWFLIDDFSSWWLVAPIIHPKFKEMTRFIDRIFSLFEKYDITSIKLESFFDRADIIEQICRQKNIQFSISKSDYLLFLKKQKIKNSFKKYGYKKITQQKIQNRLSVFKTKKSFAIPKSNYALITSPGIYRRPSWNPELKKQTNTEFFIKPILEELERNNKSVIMVDLDYTFRGTTKILEERLSEKISCLPVEFLLDLPKSKKVKKNLASLKDSINTMKQENIENIFLYKQISLWKTLEFIFEEIFFEPNLPTYLHLIDTATNFFKTNPPDVIIQVYEVGPYAKAFELAAERCNIRTIGVQHGLIPTDTPDYIFKELRTSKNLLGNIIPNLTLVFGSYYKKILHEMSSYPKNSVEPIGHPSFFNFQDIKKSLDRVEILKKYGLSDKKIILFPFSFRFTYIINSPDRILLGELYNNFKNDDDLTIIVRPHPGDNFDNKTLQKLYPSENFVCSKATLFEDLTLCDLVVIAPVSTVSSEAAMFEKPVFFVDVLEENVSETVNSVYHELINNEVVQLIPKKQLASKIDSVKKGELWKTSDSKKRHNFLSSFFNYNKKPNLFKLVYPEEK